MGGSIGRLVHKAAVCHYNNLASLLVLLLLMLLSCINLFLLLSLLLFTITNLLPHRGFSK